MMRTCLNTRESIIWSTAGIITITGDTNKRTFKITFVFLLKSSGVLLCFKNKILNGLKLKKNYILFVLWHIIAYDDRLKLPHYNVASVSVVSLANEHSVSGKRQVESCVPAGKWTCVSQAPSSPPYKLPPSLSKPRAQSKLSQAPTTIYKSNFYSQHSYCQAASPPPRSHMTDRVINARQDPHVVARTPTLPHTPAPHHRTVAYSAFSPGCVTSQRSRKLFNYLPTHFRFLPLARLYEFIKC